MLALSVPCGYSGLPIAPGVRIGYNGYVERTSGSSDDWTEHDSTAQPLCRMAGRWVVCGAFVFIAALNPCPCGYFGDPERECSCSPQMVTRYQKRISGPLLDRIDIHIEVPRVDYDKLSSDRLGEPSEAIRERVEGARTLPSKLDFRWSQRERFQGTSMVCRRSPNGGNADMGPAETLQWGVLLARWGGQGFAAGSHTCTGIAGASVQQLHMSARAYHRILKLARTIADLAGSERIETVHIAEAIQYRPRRSF